MNRNARNLLRADFVLRRRFQDLRFTEPESRFYGKLQKWPADLILRIPVQCRKLSTQGTLEGHSEIMGSTF